MEGTETRKEARLAILELANMISVPMSLNAVVRLNVADAIWQGGSNAPVSAAEILGRVLPSGDAENLQRVLRMLASYGVFEEHIDGGERKYSLTEVGKTLVTDDEGLSYGSYVLQHHQDALMRAWPLVHEAVVDPTKEPFERANGEAAYGYYLKQPEMNELMLKAMSGVSVPFMRAMLEGYDGFQGVERLVDVGGSGGDCLRMILQKHPNVREGINFDLPEVVAKAPQIPGVTHVGGNMFKSIPQGDAIFMKELKMLADQLSNVGAPISNQRLVLQLIAGLNENYDGVATFIQQIDPLPPFYEARSRLILEESRKAKQAASAANNAGTTLLTTNHSSDDASSVGQSHNSDSHPSSNRGNHGSKCGQNRGRGRNGVGRGKGRSNYTYNNGQQHGGPSQLRPCQHQPSQWMSYPLPTMGTLGTTTMGCSSLPLPHHGVRLLLHFSLESLAIVHNKHSMLTGLLHNMHPLTLMRQ
ncbi:hypothetical protein RIF29_38889 [Crotalaria pallida]|uniref:O-methyltransferase n=1 Tax=Crotalaria pallida TaxID=3830 RepID=A0AAN9E113_CROPI